MFKLLIFRQSPVITNDQELQVTQERIARLQRLLLQLRSTARPAEFQALASGYRLEIERMEAEVLDYLTRPLETEPPLEVYA
jgi:hypothetical protein